MYFCRSMSFGVLALTITAGLLGAWAGAFRFSFGG
jgi:hypothetical protein